MIDATGKPCPTCKSPMSDLRSQYMRICTGCRLEQAWPLDDKQMPLVGSSRMDRKVAIG